MTQEEAYIEGFCKTAEAYAVDPDELVKFAQASRIFSGIGGKLKGVLNNKGLKGITENLLNKAKGVTAGGIGSKLKDLGSRYLELMSGGNADKVAKGLGSLRNFKGPLRNQMLLRAIKNNPELMKVWGARVGTLGGLGLVGTIAGENKAYNRGREGKEMNWWNY